jgi:hypothetical protein
MKSAKRPSKALLKELEGVRWATANLKEIGYHGSNHSDINAK